MFLNKNDSNHIHYPKRAVYQIEWKTVNLSGVPKEQKLENQKNKRKKPGEN